MAAALLSWGGQERLRRRRGTRSARAVTRTRVPDAIGMPGSYPRNILVAAPPEPRADTKGGVGRPEVALVVRVSVTRCK